MPSRTYRKPLANVAVLRAERRGSGCYVGDLTTTGEHLGQQRVPLAARVRSPEGQLL